MTSYHARPDCYPVHCEPESPCPRHAVPAPELTAQDHADIMARATGSSSVTYRVERRNADGTLTVLETATSSPR